MDSWEKLSAQELKSNGDKNFALGNYDIAIEDYTNAIKKDPKFGRAYNNRGNAKKDSGNLEEALNDYLKGIEVEPSLPHNYHNAGRIKLRLGKYLEAIDYFTNSIKFDETNLKSESLRLKGICNLDIDNLEEGLSDIKKSLEINPNNTESIGSLGYGKLLLNLNEEAMVAAEKALRLNPQCKMALLTRGICRHEFNQNYGSIQDLDKVLNESLSAIGFYARGSAKKDLFDYKGAIKDFSSAINIYPEFPHAYHQKAVSKLFIQEYEEALIDINKAIELENNNGDFYYRRGFINAYLKQEQNAKKDFLKAEELGNRNATFVLSKQKLSMEVLFNLEEEFKTLSSEDKTENLIEQYENKILDLKEYAKKKLNSEDSNWIKTLVKTYKNYLINSNDSSEKLDFYPEKISDWQYEASACLALCVFKNYIDEGKENSIKLLARYYKDLQHPLPNSNTNYLIEVFLAGSLRILLDDYLTNSELSIGEAERGLVLSEFENKAKKLSNFKERDEFSKYATWLILEVYEITFRNIILAYTIKEKIKYNLHLVEIKEVSEKLKEVFYSQSLKNLPEKSPTIDLEEFLERFKDLAYWDLIADKILTSFENLENIDLDIDQLELITSKFYLKDFDDYDWELIEKKIFDQYPPKDISIEDSNPQAWPIHIPLDKNDVEYQSWESKYYADIYNDGFNLESIYKSLTSNNYLYDDDGDKTIESVANDIRIKMNKTYDDDQYVLNGVNKIIWQITQKNVNWEYVSETLFYYASWPNNSTWKEYYEQNQGLSIRAQKGELISIWLLDNEDNKKYLQNLGYVENEDISADIKIGEFFKTPSIFMKASEKENDFDCLNFYHIPNKNCCFSKEFIEESFGINKEKIILVEEINLEKAEEGFINSIPSFLPPKKVYKDIEFQKGKDLSIKSWDNYYEKFKDSFNNGFRNIISLRNNEHTVFLLKELGYKENKLDKEDQKLISINNIGDLKIGEYTCSEELSQIQGTSNNAIHLLHRSFGGKNPFTLEDEDWWSDSIFFEKWIGLESNLILKIGETIDFDSMFDGDQKKSKIIDKNETYFTGKEKEKVNKERIYQVTLVGFQAILKPGKSGYSLKGIFDIEDFWGIQKERKSLLLQNQTKNEEYNLLKCDPVPWKEVYSTSEEVPNCIIKFIWSENDKPRILDIFKKDIDYESELSIESGREVKIKIIQEAYVIKDKSRYGTKFKLKEIQLLPNYDDTLDDLSEFFPDDKDE